MTPLRRQFLPCASIAALALLATLSTPSAIAQAQYPEKGIRLVVGFLPGGPPDIAARVLAQELTEAWGKPVVVENMPGAAGNVAAERVAKLPADGYTLMMAGSAAIATNISLYEKLAFDPVKDFTPISQVCFTTNILVVRNELPVKSVQELVALARAQPGKLTFASGGIGTSQHLAGELFKTMASLDIQHVPYRGSPAVMPDLLGGRVTMIFANISTVLPLIREGKVRGLAVTSLERSSAVPDLPTMQESGFPGFEADAWFGLVAPAGTPKAIVEKVQSETARILKLADVRSRFGDLGMVPIGNASPEFAAIIKSQIPYWAKVIKASGARSQ
jgi:tripartite-type tricarboxylate transporter receptor subunit TctC